MLEINYLGNQEKDANLEDFQITEDKLQNDDHFETPVKQTIKSTVSETLINQQVKLNKEILDNLKKELNLDSDKKVEVEVSHLAEVKMIENGQSEDTFERTQDYKLAKRKVEQVIYKQIANNEDIEVFYKETPQEKFKIKGTDLVKLQKNYNYKLSLDSFVEIEGEQEAVISSIDNILAIDLNRNKGFTLKLTALTNMDIDFSGIILTNIDYTNSYYDAEILSLSLSDSYLTANILFKDGDAVKDAILGTYKEAFKEAIEISNQFGYTKPPQSTISLEVFDNTKDIIVDKILYYTN